VNSPNLGNRDFQTDVITYCLTGKCAECTGSYVNRILNHRLLCNCGCHKKEKALYGVAGQPELNTESTTPMAKEEHR
jgi:hypothetical protein